ncbi:phage tail assembly protein [Serratia ficaria]|uniref:phage tail assembly protein n=1 Tax=Serratia ficaria TaxID=61651 RepID=UPI00217AADBF|nr:phage tail assembly protein [Serratia ficaria]CAI0743477.1 Mu-like prophage FluMu protein gp41 [Serratia ficaria]CAI0789115.1 Mu-like prophage FluMu protein gp41 [Serratia ficaria]CAI1617182.1 Mu-like prophage FluMu protein gp41 [Serratia ficaria]CAI2407335.1 Mu-like prophage FluMu protein gp41 [Serratia ficaria]CAI2439473.1 Mu-like prophage FluMu protein gp41 [Serratia ficaria]
MAQMTVTLIHGLVTGKGTSDEATHVEVTLRELGSKDIVDAQLAAERVVIGENGKAVAYCSEVLMGLELLRRQIASIGSIPGPLSLKQLYQLHPKDLNKLTTQADELDDLLAEVADRGRADAAGDGTQ